MNEFINQKPLQLENLSTNEAFEKLHKNTLETIKKCRLSFRPRIKAKREWITDKSLNLKFKMNKLRKKFLEIRTTESEISYKEMKKRYSKQTRIDKENFYKNKLKNCNGDSKKTWKIINELLERKDNNQDVSNEITFDNRSLTSNKEISSAFNKFYQSIALKITDKIPKSENSSNFYLENYINDEYETPFHLKTVTTKEVFNIIRNLKSKTSNGPDGISNKTLRNTAQFYVKDLTTCINKSLLEGKFPDLLKTSKISPLFKKNSPRDPNNYRPIAQISPFSKIFEKVALKQINEFYEKNDILTDNQFGFREKHSTSHALLLTKNYIEMQTKENKTTILIGIDLSKAFDCIKTDGLLQNKVNKMIRNKNISSWINSYYQDRVQFTNWQGVNSETIKCNQISIVQGSALGPSMFISFINDLSKVSEYFCILFADDTNLLMSDKDPKSLEIRANLELKKVKDYFDANQLAINIDKSNFIIINNKKK